MRIMIIVLSLFIGLVMLDVTVVALRLTVLLDSRERPHEAFGSLAIFAAWTVATALVYRFPGAACWVFVLAGGAAIVDGVTYSIEAFTLWGVLAVALAVLASVARREKRHEDEIALARTQHDLAVHTVLLRLSETVPELITPPPVSDDPESAATTRGLPRPQPVPGYMATAQSSPHIGPR